MQGAADLHDPIADARLPQVARVVDDTAALDTAVDVLDAHAAARNTPICRLLRARQGPAPWLPGGHDDVDMAKRKPRKADILQPAATRG
jgi:hypothetical protein